MYVMIQCHHVDDSVTAYAVITWMTKCHHIHCLHVDDIVSTCTVSPHLCTSHVQTHSLHFHLRKKNTIPTFTEVHKMKQYHRPTAVCIQKWIVGTFNQDSCGDVQRFRTFCFHGPSSTDEHCSLSADEVLKQPVSLNLPHACRSRAITGSRKNNQRHCIR